MAKSVSNDVSKPVLTGSIVIDDKQVIKLVTEKDAIIKEGREVSKEIDDVQKRIDELTEQEYEITAKVEPKDLIDKGEKLKEEINSLIKQLEEIASDIKQAKLDAIPEEIQKEHLSLNSKREKLEQRRNKMALKVQKIKDRMIPKIQKIAVPHLEEYEDLLSAELKKGKVVVSKFSHLEEWKKQWNKRQEEAKTEKGV